MRNFLPYGGHTAHFPPPWKCKLHKQKIRLFCVWNIFVFLIFQFVLMFVTIKSFESLKIIKVRFTLHKYEFNSQLSTHFKTIIHYFGVFTLWPAWCSLQSGSSDVITSRAIVVVNFLSQRWLCIDVTKQVMLDRTIFISFEDEIWCFSLIKTLSTSFAPLGIC